MGGEPNLGPDREGKGGDLVLCMHRLLVAMQQLRQSGNHATAKGRLVI